jgi:alkylated DNA repair dioxygenase AlkB
LYRTGKDSNGWHADNEKELGEAPVIYSLSFGQTRKFQLKHLKTGERINLELNSGSLLIMGGEIQHYWKHQVPKQLKIAKDRVNLTFRYII